MPEVAKTKFEQEWERFHLGLVKYNTTHDVEMMARLAFVAGFNSACISLQESSNVIDVAICDNAWTVFQEEADKWRRLKAAELSSNGLAERIDDVD